uniref:Retrovirus-related Pol polyprotein from transposon TNT 1-94-like beta-barrel domain-containing protein n=1 Tax=Passalora fulva TaxID=5499 RepID=A0A9Q8USZ2_PASFU
MENETGFIRKRAAPLLTRENHETWFKLMRIHLVSKQVDWVLEDIITDIPAATPSIATPSASSESSLPLDQAIRKASYRRHNATALYEMYICLSTDDQEMTYEIRHAKELWEWAEAKYKRRLLATGRSLLQQYTNFVMTEDQSIDDAWQELSSIARRAVSISPQFQDIKTEDRKIQQLLAALPDSFGSIRDAIDAQVNLSPQDILAILREKQESMIHQGTAMFAKKGFQGKLTCHLCGGDHFMSKCPHLSAAQQAVRNKDKLARVTYPAKRQPSPPRRRSSSPNLRDVLKVMTDLAKQMKESRKPKASSSKPARAHATQEDASDPEIPSEDDDVDEVAHSTVEAKGKYPSSEWLLDSCASSHMTDQDSLFRTLKPLQKRKWIKVGGGYLQATHMGSAVMGGPSGKQIVLENVLFVPGLGVSLVSWNQFSQQFAVQPPSFTLKSLSVGAMA